MSRRPAVLLAAGLVAVTAAGHAQDPPPPPAGQPFAGQPPGFGGQPFLGQPPFGPPGMAPAPAAKTERAVYTVKGGDPGTLAEVVNKHFRREVEASGTPAGVVLSGSAASIAEATKLLAQLDRRPRSVELEVTLVEVSGKDADLPAGEVDGAKLAELAKGGSVQRVRLTAAEGQPVTAQSGGDKPYLSSSVFGPARGPGGFGGPKDGDPAAPPARPRAVQQSINYRPTGTVVKATASVGGDGAVSVALSVEDTAVRPAATGDEVGAATFEQSSLTTKLVVPAGKAVVAHAARKDGKDARTVTLVVVTAKVAGGKE